MRFLPALALAALTSAAALASGPASALEACPMERAIYQAKDAPEYRIEFKADTEHFSQANPIAELRIGGGHVLDVIGFASGNSPHLGWYTASGKQSGPAYAMNSDLSAARFGPDAPATLVLGDLFWLTEDKFGIRFGAWILTECR